MTGAMSEEFVQVACDLLQRGDTDALISLEWDPRPGDELSSWLDATALARAQGRTRGATSALGIACAHLLHPELPGGELRAPQRWTPDWRTTDSSSSVPRGLTWRRKSWSTLRDLASVSSRPNGSPPMRAA